MLTPSPILPAKPVSFTRPTLSVWTVVSVTKLRSEDEVLAAIQDGRLRWAWNVAGAKAEKKMVRVLAQSVLDLLHGGEALQLSELDSFPQALRAIFPFERPSILASDISRAFNCSGYHISNLLKQGLLQLAPQQPARNPKDSPKVDFSSVASFLQERRVL